VIKEIIFDCFGVLTQDGWTVFLKKYGTEDTLDELRYLNRSVDSGLISFDEFVKSVCEVSGADKSDVMTIMVNGYHPEEDVFELIKGLKKSYKIGLISNISAPIKDYLPTAPLELFDHQTLSYEVGIAKPTIGIYEQHLLQTGTEPSQAVFIDDREVNCDGARAAGMKAIWYQNIDQLKRDLAGLGVNI